MTELYKRLTTRLKSIIPSIILMYYILDRHNLISKNENTKIFFVLNLVIKIINDIKHNSKSDRLFKQFCIGRNEFFIRLLYNTEIR
ncbi:hypothetical protein A0H76_1853 [Hepatospora eriocheir]|uniref:Uncharacterized protein n=1 Tax=Hepatospora eriocheir TaxID=1081669 RepID=A0A1X0QGP6_9MICR|nr:hypothetical protein HERIO_2405 [Hepatospora eriocheir]ORD98834.1 hypothetical protein A0H76_1853 [Hepatospora eriocheir]